MSAPVSDREWAALREAARSARERAYAPYSGFAVGAAVLAGDGRVFAGCNVENGSYGLSCCAERVALFQAVAAGARDFRAILVLADTPEPVRPCGACRQVMAEFGADWHVAMENTAGRRDVLRVADLLPLAFGLSPSGRGTDRR